MSDVHRTFANAAQRGNLNNLKWLHSVGCPYDKTIKLVNIRKDIREWIDKNLK